MIKRELIIPKNIIIHSISEYISGKSAPEFIKSIGLDCHYFIQPDGNVINQIVTHDIDLKNGYIIRGLHAGVSKHEHKYNLNWNSIGIELMIEGEHSYEEFLDKIKTDCYTESQIESCLKLVRELSAHFRIKKCNVIRHSDVSGDDIRGKGKGKKDPGEGFNYEKFIKDI